MASLGKILLLSAVVCKAAVLDAQSAQQLIQRVVDTEHFADQADHSNWVYLEEIRKPGEHLSQWVASTQHGNVERPLERNDALIPEAGQHEAVEDSLHDRKAQSKQIEESDHDNKQVDDLLKLLPVAFVWTKVNETSTSTTFHFEPAPNFHPPTREARVFSSMTGDLTADNHEFRIVSIRGHLMREVTFAGGLLGKLNEGSSFSLEQEEVGPNLWQLTQIHVHLSGTALLFKSISLEQDDERSRFEAEPASVTLDQAAEIVMTQPEDARQLKALTR